MKNCPLLTTALLFSCFLATAQTNQSCNFAGTSDIGTFIGQSNLVGPDRIFLCFGDSVLIHHNGDADLSGDPQPATPSGISYAFYTCPPTVSGDNLQAIAANPGPGDPCLLSQPPPANGLYATLAVPNGGDTWFFNNGSLINTFGFGQPLELYFAPITIDVLANTGFETSVVGAPPGPCVQVNTQDAFSVVYLNKIQERFVDNNFGNDCLGRFQLAGGYPEFDPAAVYDVDISLVSNPAIKALQHIPKSMLFHNINLVFSVTEPGAYLVSVEDGVSCGRQFLIDMSGCEASDNLTFKTDTVSGAPGETLCVPIRVRNFDIASGSLSFTWNPLLLQYQHVVNLNPAIAGFFNPNTFLNTAQATEGMLGMVLYNIIDLGAPINIADNEVLFELCLEVIDTLSACTAIGFAPDPAQIAFEDPDGEFLAVTAIPGNVCAKAPQTPIREPLISLDKKVHPNPVKSGQEVLVTTLSHAMAVGYLTIRNVQGDFIREESIALHAGENNIRVSTLMMRAGVYIVTISNPEGRTRSTFKLVVYGGG